jgi:hypothetical protein
MTNRDDRGIHALVLKVLDPKENVLWIGFALLSAAYFFTYINANSELLTKAAHDDALYVQLGESIAAGNWLGEYNKLTLVKTPGFAVFVAFCIKTGLPYLWLTAVFQVVAVTFLLRKSGYLFHGARLLLFVAGGLLLFNPILAGALRIYRFQLPAICFLVFLGSIIHLYDKDGRKSHWSLYSLDLLTAFIAFALLWFSREEFLYYAACLVVGLTCYLFGRHSLAHPVRNLSYVFSGLLGVGVFWLFICGMNFGHYGRFIVCEKTSSPYTDAIKTFLSISDPDLPHYISGSTSSREKILRIAREVPEFQPMAKELIGAAGRWRGTYLDNRSLEIVEKPENFLTVSHFEWAWIDAASACGYYESARRLASYYEHLNGGLERAMTEGRLAKDSRVLAQAGPYVFAKADLVTIAGMLTRNYRKLFLRPFEIVRDYKNLVARISMDSTGDEATREIWAGNLGVNYLSEGDVSGMEVSVESLSNRVWNWATAIYAYIAVPLIHLATPLALIAIITAGIRKRWLLAGVIGVLVSFYFGHYLMLTILDVAGGYNATHKNYFLPSYGTLLFAAFSSLSIILRCLKGCRF